MSISLHSVRRARWATSATFFINGLIMATWVSRIPAIKDQTNINDGQLGLALLGIAVGALLSFLLVGSLIARYGSRRVTMTAGLMLSLTLLLLSLSTSLPALTMALIGFGATSGAMDVAMNAQGVEVEKQLHRSIMASLHGVFSLGGLSGAVCGSFLAGQHWTPTTHFGVVALVAAALIVLSGINLLPPAPSETTEKVAPALALPHRAVLGFGVIACCAFITEGAMADWTAIYLRDALGTSSSYAAVGFAAFSSTMTLARFGGDSLANRLGASRLVAGGGLLSAFGMIAALLTHHPLVALVGFACVGAGMVSVVPVVFSAAGATPGLAPGTGIASVATMGYAGFLAGPASIGFLAHHTSIRLALWVIVLPGLLITFLATRLLRSSEVVSQTAPVSQTRNTDEDCSSKLQTN